MWINESLKIPLYAYVAHKSNVYFKYTLYINVIVDLKIVWLKITSTCVCYLWCIINFIIFGPVSCWFYICKIEVQDCQQY